MIAFPTKVEALRHMKLMSKPIPEILKIKVYSGRNAYGYEYAGRQILEALAMRGMSFTSDFDGAADVLFGPPSWIYYQEPTPRTVVFTMHETTRFKNHILNCLDVFGAVVVPSQWGASCLSAQGVNNPLYVCPLGYNPVLKSLPLSTSGIFKFGCVAQTKDERKSLNELIEAFKAVEGNCELHILCPFDLEVSDPRVFQVKHHLPEPDYHNWLSQIHCGVFPSKGEGFGLCQLEFAAAGTPVIHTGFGPVLDYLPNFPEILIPGEIIPASGNYENQGHWFKPSIAGLRNCMQTAANHKGLFLSLGIAFRHKARQYTWENTANVLQEILRKERLVR